MDRRLKAYEYDKLSAPVLQHILESPLFSPPRSDFTPSPASFDFYFLHVLRRYTTFGNYDIWTSCELERVVEAVSEFIFALKKLNERV